VKAFGPGIEKGKVKPGVPANFTIDSSKTGPATIDVDILGNLKYTVVLQTCRFHIQKLN
jgi:hypothetical protein